MLAEKDMVLVEYKYISSLSLAFSLLVKGERAITVTAFNDI